MRKPTRSIVTHSRLLGVLHYGFVPTKKLPSAQLTNLESDFGSAVKAGRRALGITQEELAWRADLHRTYIADIEGGRRNITLRSIAALASALQIPIAALVPATTTKKDVASKLMEILIVENDAADAELVVRSLAKANVSNPIRVLCDEAEALDFLLGLGVYAKKRPALPGLILLDLQVSKISAFDVLARIKAERRTRKIPVVVMIDSQQDAVIRECIRMGVESCILKPVDFECLVGATPKLGFRWALLRPDQALVKDNG